MFDVQATAHPDDRKKFAAYPQKFFINHKPGPDGVLVAIEMVQWGKKGTDSGWNTIVEWKRLLKDNPELAEYFRPWYEAWKRGEGLVTNGFDLRAWPAITEGQIAECKRMGLLTVEDLAAAGDGIRRQLGQGAGQLIANAQSFMANKDAAAAAGKIASLEGRVEELLKSNEEARAMIDQLMAERGRKPQRPQTKPVQEEAA